jgi:hypothetical protein
MTTLDIIQALMAGAGISQYQAAQALRDHDAEVRRKVLADTMRRDAFTQAAFTGLLAARGGVTPPEELVHAALQHVDIMLKELDK